MNSRTNIFFLITFHAKHYLLQNHCVLGLINWIDLLEFMMRLDIYYYSDLEKMMPFKIR